MSNRTVKASFDKYDRLKDKLKQDPSILNDPEFKDQLDAARLEAQRSKTIQEQVFVPEGGLNG